MSDGLRYRGPYTGISQSAGEQSIRQGTSYTTGELPEATGVFEDIELGEVGAEAAEGVGLAAEVGTELGAGAIGGPVGLAIGGIAALGTIGYHIAHTTFTDPNPNLSLSDKAEAFKQWSNTIHQEYQQTQGAVIPGHNYLGPGNSLDSGKPTNEVDADAQSHDIAYSEAQNNQDIKDADHKFVAQTGDHIAEGLSGNENLQNTLGALAGHIGIGIKQNVEEHITGPLYPNINAKPMPAAGKRPGGKLGGTETDKGAKQPNLQRYPTDQSIDSGIADADMSPNLPGTGAAQASGGASSDGQPIYVIERPFSDFGKKQSVYRKVHKLMSFAFAPVIIDGVNNENQRFMTTHMAEIPWELPVFYLSPSEYEGISAGARVTAMHIEVKYRGSVIQFEIGATTSGLATLNQINDIATATGLNKTGYGLNLSYNTFDSTDPMIVTAYAEPKYGPIAGPPAYRGLAKQYYGTNNSDLITQKYIPHHQLGIPSFLVNYFNIVTRVDNGGTAVANLYGGWPDVNSKYVAMDGKTVVDQKVLEMEYQPKQGFIKPPHKAYILGDPCPVDGTSADVVTNGNLPAMRQAKVQHDPNSLQTASTTVTESILAMSNDASSVLDYYKPIEKAQIVKSGYWGQADPHVQPSAHIGVFPVPALNPQDVTLDSFHKWTDARAYWEVTATMVVVENTPTNFPYATEYNVPQGDVIHLSSTNPAAFNDYTKNGTLLCGLYQNQVPAYTITPPPFVRNNKNNK